MKGELRLGTFVIPASSREYSPGWIDFEVTGRTIDNTLVSDFIGFKRKFSISWSNWLDGEFVEYLLSLYQSKEDVTFTEVKPDGTEQSWTCKLSISDAYVREYEEDNFAYSGFEIMLEEV